jgi:hypothetical protein
MMGDLKSLGDVMVCRSSSGQHADEMINRRIEKEMAAIENCEH